MLNPFRRKVNIAVAAMEKAKNERAADLERIKGLCVEIGRTLLKCAMVEGQINDVLDFITPEGIERGSWLRSGERPALKQAIKEMRRRFGIDRDFYDELDRFRECRNKFVHHIWDISKARLNTAEGQDEVKAFVVDLYVQASYLNMIFHPMLMQHFGKELGWRQETIESLLPDEMRTSNA